MLNSRIDIEDKDFAIEDGIFLRNLAHGNIAMQFGKLAEKAVSSKLLKIVKELKSLQSL